MERMKKNLENKNKMVVYQAKNGAIELRQDLKRETVWATQAQIAEVFNIERSVVTKHIGNILEDKEIHEKSNVQKMHIANSDKPVSFYNLDMIISVGYRVNSRRATQFRIWATKTLKDYLVKGYAVNEKRLLEAKEKFNELQTAISFLQNKSQKEMLTGQSQEILNLLSGYAKTLTLLSEYDNGKINDNALTALALLVAESKPSEKDVMIKIIMNLIAK